MTTAPTFGKTRWHAAPGIYSRSARETSRPLWVYGRDLRRGEGFGAMHDLVRVEAFDGQLGQPEHSPENVRRIVSDRRRAAPDPPRRQRHFRHHPVDADRYARLPVEDRYRHLTRRIMFVRILVAGVVHPGAADLGLVQRRLDLAGGARRAILAQAPVELAAFPGVHRRCILRAGVVAVLGPDRAREIAAPGHRSPRRARRYRPIRQCI